MTKVLFWYDRRTYTDIDRAVRYFEADPIVIDPGFVFKRESGRSPIAYDNLQDAIDGVVGHHWVFLCDEGNQILDEFTHPDEGVVYAFGNNHCGFGVSIGSLRLVGDVVRLRNPEIVHDYQAMQMVLYDRELFFGGRRAK
jgi:hypothetical protein